MADAERRKQDRKAQAWAARHLRVPVLVAMGEADMLWNCATCAPLVEAWLTAAPVVESAPIAGGAHFVQEGNPAALSEAILDFMERN